MFIMFLVLWFILFVASNLFLILPLQVVSGYSRVVLPVVVNAFFIIGAYLLYKFYRERSKLNEELKMVRTELTQALKEAFEYTKSLEKSNERISELESANLDDQEQINEILSELSIYTNQLESIVNTIDAGICTIDRDGIIQADFNKGFRQIFGDKEYWESSIYDTVFYNLPHDDKEELKKFIEVAFSNVSSSDNMLNGANPVSEFVYIYNQEGKIENKYISSKVSRILNDRREVEKLMFVFNDITLQKILEEDIKNRERKYQDELNLLTNIFQHDKETIVSFINDLNERLNIIKESISRLEIEKKSPDILREIQRLVHSTKGEAFTLGFESLAKSCQEMENFIKENYNSVIDTEKNLILLEHFQNVEHWKDKLNDVAQRIFSYAKDGNLEVDRISVSRNTYEDFVKGFRKLIDLANKKMLSTDQLVDYYERIARLDYIDMQRFKKELELIAEKSAVHYRKKVELNFIYDIDGLPVPKYRVLKEIFLHLIRNSVAHGIEDQELRLKRGKDKTGRINIHIFEEDNSYIVRYSDDGAGFDVNLIKKKAIEKGLITEQEANNISDNEAIKFIFTDGFSSKDEIDPVSGTGVGMSVIKNNITNLLYGSLSITNKPLKGVSFLIKFPK